MATKTWQSQRSVVSVQPQEGERDGLFAILGSMRRRPLCCMEVSNSRLSSMRCFLGEDWGNEAGRMDIEVKPRDLGLRSRPPHSN